MPYPREKTPPGEPSGPSMEEEVQVRGGGEERVGGRGVEGGRRCRGEGSWRGAPSVDMRRRWRWVRWRCSFGAVWKY